MHVDLQEPDRKQRRSLIGRGPRDAEKSSSTAWDANRRRPRRALVIVNRCVLLAVLLGIWQWYGATRGGIFVPSVTETLGTLGDLVRTGALYEAIWRSNQSLLIGYPLSVLIGLCLGYLTGRNRLADRALSYWIDISLVIPMVAIIPVIIVALGLGLTSRVVVVALFAMPVIAINARASVRVISQELVEMAESFEATRRQIWTAVILPSAIPQTFTGLRIGLGRAISGMVIIELLLVPAGLGGLLLEYKSSFQANELYAVTLVVLAEGLLVTSVAQALERRVARRMNEGTA